MPSAVAVIPAIPAARSFVLHERGRVGPRAARAELRDRVGAAITLSAPLQGTPIGDAHGKTRDISVSRTFARRVEESC